MSSEAYKRIRIINARARALKVVRSVTRALTVDVVNDAISFLPLAAAAVGSGPRTHGRARSDAQASKLKDCIGRASLLVNIAFMSWLSARDLTKGPSADQPCPVSWSFCRNISTESRAAQAFLSFV